MHLTYLRNASRKVAGRKTTWILSPYNSQGILPFCSASLQDSRMRKVSRGTEGDVSSALGHAHHQGIGVGDKDPRAET